MPISPSDNGSSGFRSITVIDTANPIHTSPAWTPRRSVQALTRVGALTRSLSKTERIRLSEQNEAFRNLLGLVYTRLPDMNASQV